MSFASGTRLGPYEIVAPIGAGGMGEVYRAHDMRLGRDVAIKVLAPHLAATPEVRARFEREARTISQLNHPHICALYDIGHEDGTEYLVMELLEGETLAGRLEKGPLPTAEVLTLGAQIADALDRAHRAGVVHRDLKPGNVMLTRSGAKLMDFGLARPAGAVTAPGSLTESPTVSRPLTAEGTIVGTFQYMAPEQLEGKDADARSDIWALGCVLYEMATGKRAFEDTSQASLIAAIMDHEPAAITDLQPLTPPALEHLARRCLAKDPAERWQSARDVMHELQWIAATGAHAGSQTGAAAPAAAAMAAATRGRRGWTVLLWPLVGLLGVALGAVTTAALTKRAGSRAISFSPKTFQQYPIFRARFAPDGQSIVFSAAPEGNTPELFSIRPEYIAPRPLGLHGVHLLSVSRSGELAVLTNARHLAHMVFTGTLARLPLGAEVPRELLEGVRDADWSPDGSGLAIIREVAGKDRLEYPIGKVLVESGGYLSDLRFSPRGDRIAFLDHPMHWDDRGSVKLVDLAGRVAELSSGHSSEEGLAWSPDGKQIHFSAAETGFKYRVFGVTPSGRLRVAQESAGSMRILDVSRSGRWIVARDDIRLAVMVRPPGGGAERDMSWLDGSVGPFLTPDGRTFAFTENGGEHNGNYIVCLKKTDDSPAVPLGEGMGGPVSPDGKWVLAFVPTQPMQAVLYPTGAGEPVKLERGGIESYEIGWWCPDGRRIVFCGIEAGHGPRMYVQEIPTGKPRPCTPEGTRWGILSPDGSQVLAQSSDGTWALYPLAGGAAQPVPHLSSRDTVVRWCSDGRSAYVTDEQQLPSRVERLNLADGRRELVLLLGTENRTGLLNVAGLSLADDPNVYAYFSYRMLSVLFAADGAR